jgi:hypothetical protein
MLQQNTQVLELNKVVVLRLTTGEEIIGKVVDITAKEVTIHMPCLASMGPNGVGLMPATFLGDQKEDIVYQRSAIIGYPTKINKEAAQVYEDYSSEIKVPHKPGILVPNGR